MRQTAPDGLGTGSFYGVHACRCGWQAFHSGRGRQVIGSFAEGLAPFAFASLLTSFS